jgi:hypothetical protein
MSVLLSQNVYKLQDDSERRLAHRSEIKRSLAEIQVRQSRIAELRAIIHKLEHDSETAADSHTEQTGRLQAELKDIDQKHVDAVLASTELPQKDVARRGQILDEIQTLNKALEERCDSNKRSAQPILKEIQTLVMQNTQGGALRNQLAALCSVELRRQRMLNGHLLQWMQPALRDAQRIIGVEEHNILIHQKNGDAALERVQVIKRDDWLAVVKSIETEISKLQSQAREIEAQALAE